MTSDAQRRRAIGQILLLAAGLVVLVAISAASVVLVNQARKDNAWVVHTVEVENQLSTLLLQIRRAESSARGYLLTSEPRFLTEHESAIGTILPDIDKYNSMHFAEKIRKLTEKASFKFEDTEIPVTVSVGVASLGRDVTEALEFIKMADDVLYQAKNAGRNRVVG